MKIGLITTIDTNIGDDFIREGILNVLRKILPETQIEFVMINKENPYTLYPKWHPVYWTKFVPKKKRLVSGFFSRLTAWAGMSVFEKCDVIIQCGAPVYWYDCHKADWAEVFWRGIAKRLSKRIPVLNVAAGSCYPWERIPEKVDEPRDAAYIKEIFDICELTIVRDSRSEHLLKSLGLDPIVLPCSAFLAAMPYKDLEQTNEYVFINYMPGGSHYDFGQNIDSEKWASTLRNFIRAALPQHKMAFICHNQKEYDAARELVPEIECFFPKTVEEYFRLAVRGKAGIFNRMHASVGFAGLGIPSMAIGADTRMLMVDQIGLPTIYVKEATDSKLLQVLGSLVDDRDVEQKRLLNLQMKTFDRYVNELGRVLT